MILETLKSFIHDSKQKIRSKRDELRLKKYDPIFRNYSNATETILEKLKPVYNKYVNDISSAEMAVSLQTAVLLYYISEKKKPKNILDLGSGLSSYILRLYAKNQKECIKVYSVDDNKVWLKKTEEFLIDQNLPSNNLYELEAFDFKTFENNFDLVFHDLGNMNIRQAYLSDAVRSCTLYNGIAVLDDIHKSGYKNSIIFELSNLNYKYYNLDWITKDEYGRAAGLLTGINPSKN